MNLFRRHGPRRLPQFVSASPLRRVDPRVKLELSLLIALAVMLPLERLALFWLGCAALTIPLRLAPAMAYQVRRILWLLVLLFVIDWIGVGFEFAVLITLRSTLVVSAFIIFFATTRPEEFRLALERMWIPYRYAFALSLAFLSITMMNEEWQLIWEAQHARGVQIARGGLRGVGERVNGLVALGLPAVVLTVKRAWTFTEAAYTRGFDSPHRRPYRQLVMQAGDWLLSTSALVIIVLIFIWR